MIKLEFSKKIDKNLKILEVFFNESQMIINDNEIFKLDLNFKQNISEIYKKLDLVKINWDKKIQVVLNTQNKQYIDYIIYIIFNNFFNVYSKKTKTFRECPVIIFVDKLINNFSFIIKDIYKIYESVYLSKWLGDLDSFDDGTPEMFSKTVNELFKNKHKNLSINILDKDNIKSLDLNLINAVGYYSKNPPYLVEINFKNNKYSNEYTAIIGKGVTFDTGGYALKSSESIRTMRLDKCGAADVVGVIKYLIEKDIKDNILALIPLVENTLANNSILPSQVIKSFSGKTVQIDNPDAEGRLILADAISYAQQNYKCKEVITIATLTGSITISLGKYMSGLFTNNYNLANEFKNKCDATGDEVWILPIHEENIKAIRNAEIGDITNCPLKSKHGSSSQAAAFILEFILPSVNFLHIDIAGTAVIENRASGSMVKGLINYLSNK